MWGDVNRITQFQSLAICLPALSEWCIFYAFNFSYSLAMGGAEDGISHGGISALRVPANYTCTLGLITYNATQHGLLCMYTWSGPLCVILVSVAVVRGSTSPLMLLWLYLCDICVLVTNRYKAPVGDPASSACRGE